MVLIIYAILFQMFSFGTSTEDTIRSETISYLEVFEKAGIHEFGEAETVALSEIKKDVLNARFVVVSDGEFSKNIDKSRRSAFYEKNLMQPRIFINEDYLPEPDLIIHEILQDQHYEFSIAMSSLHDELIKADPEFDSISANIYEKSTDLMFDHFGIKTKYLEVWVGSESLTNFQLNNSTLFDDGGEGGDVSGGGGDQHSFLLKKEILQFVIQKIRVELQIEFPNMSHRELADILSQSHVRLLRKVYIDTDYKNTSSKIEFNIAKDFREFGFESDFAMVPYFIKVPVNMDRLAAVVEISNVIFQTMFVQMPFVNNQYFSPCSCVSASGEQMNTAFRCPNQQVHPALKEMIQIVTKEIEYLNRCKINLKP